ncbi:MAG: porin [Anaeromyxobacteraceae bacterium]|nr:porin [Anaeromyxobacteraceae bacterium]
MKRLSLVAALLMLALATPASAEDAPGVFKVPGTNSTLKIYGFAQLDLTYDFNGADDNVRGADWATFLEFQPLDEGKVDKNRMYLTAKTSRIGFITTTPTAGGPITVRVEGDFNSPSAFNYSTEATTNGTNFRMRHGYGEYGGFLVGQTWANFMDLGSLTDTVDFNPHGAFALTRSPGVRYTHKFARATLALALENSQSVVVNSDVSQSYTVGREYDRLPDVSASLTVPFSMGHFNLRALTHEYQGRVGAVGDSARAWGAGASGSVNFANDSLVWSVQGGDGIGRYMFQSLFQGAAFVGNDIKLWQAYAYHLGLTHKWSPNFRSNLAWTQTFFKKDDALAAAAAASPFGNGAANKSVDAAYVNSFYSPVKGIEIGLEYAYGKRTVFAAALADPTNDVGTQHRINANVHYDFY